MRFKKKMCRDNLLRVLDDFMFLVTPPKTGTLPETGTVTLFICYKYKSTNYVLFFPDRPETNAPDAGGR